MITGQPDSSLDLARLEREMAALRAEVAAAPRWFFREKYVDRGPLDPFYILDYRAEAEVEDAGDDLMGEPLFATRSRALAVKRITRERSAEEGGYWQPIAGADLVGRLERFMTMYREDYHQPPGTRGDLLKPELQHPRFEAKRFLFRIGTEGRKLLGVGPKMFAGLAREFAALLGTVTDQAGVPLRGITVEIIGSHSRAQRVTRSDGQFFFSRLLPGNYRIRFGGTQFVVSQENGETFGRLRARVTDAQHQPLIGVVSEIVATDNEAFTGPTDSGGNFDFGPLPACGMAYRIPGHRFSVTQEEWESR